MYGLINMNTQTFGLYSTKQFSVAVPISCGNGIKFDHIEKAKFTKLEEISDHYVYHFTGYVQPRVFRVQNVKCTEETFKRSVRLIF